MGTVIVIFALILSLVFWQQPFEGDLFACVYIDGDFVEAIPLTAELKTIEMKTPYGTNEMMILDNKVYITESDCGANQCVNTGSISRPHQSIVCAPHGLVITIEDAGSVEDK